MSWSIRPSPMISRRLRRDSVRGRGLTSAPLRTAMAWMALVAAIWAGGAPSAAASQASGATITVTVVDQSGAVVAGVRAALSVIDASAQTPRSVGVTDAAGRARFEGLDVGRYEIALEMPGFAPRTVAVTITHERQTVRLTAPLELAGFVEVVRVEADPRLARSDARGTAFKRVLTSDDLAALPDDPDELALAIRAMAGPGAVVRVDGFTGGRLPPKSAISSIRFSYSDFSAEYHEYTLGRVDIETKPGLDQFQGSALFTYRPTGLSARDATALQKTPVDVWGGEAALQGPIVKGRMSFMAVLTLNRERTAKLVDALTPTGPSRAALTARANGHMLWATVSLRAGQSQVVRVRYREFGVEAEQMNVGGLVLPEHAASSRRIERELLGIWKGALWPSTFNQTRVSIVNEGSSAHALTPGPTVLVPGAFTGGGADRGGGQRSWRARLADDLDVQMGRHALRFGLEGDATHLRSDAWESRAGTFVYATLDDYLAQRPLLVTWRFGDPGLSLETWRATGYVQDDIMISRSLTASAGLRFEKQSGISGLPVACPRASVTWAPFDNTAVRAGYGRYREWIGDDILETTVALDGQRQHEFVAHSPDEIASLLGGRLGEVLPDRYQIAPTVTLPRFDRYVLSVDQKLGSPTTVAVSLVAIRGRSILRGANVNGADGTGNRPDPRFARIIEAQSVGSLTDSQLRVEVRHRLARPNLGLWMHYALGRVLDDSDGPFAVPADPNRPDLERGAAATDVRHQIGIGGVVVAGPHLFAFVDVSARTGTPYSITTGLDDNADGFVTDRPAGVSRNSARATGMLTSALSVKWRQALARKAPSTKGEAKAGSGPVLEIGLDIRNALNTVTRIGYVGVSSSPLFKQATGALSARRVTFKMTLRF